MYLKKTCFFTVIDILLLLPTAQIALATGRQIMVYIVNQNQELILKKTLPASHRDTVKSMKLISGM